MAKPVDKARRIRYNFYGILKMISLISNGILPAANSMFAPNGKLIRGIHIHLMWELQELEGVEEDTNARD